MMKLHVLNRKVHYWGSIILALPILMILASGLLLQLKKQWSWVQPPEQRGTGSEPIAEFAAILDALKRVPDLNVRSWDDVARLDIRPKRGIAKVLLNSGWEIQLDLADAAVLQTAVRRSDWIESLHDGSAFAGNWSKLGLFLPSAFGLLLLWITGLWLFWHPILVKSRRAKTKVK